MDEFATVTVQILISDLVSNDMSVVEPASDLLIDLPSKIEELILQVLEDGLDVHDKTGLRSGNFEVSTSL